MAPPAVASQIGLPPQGQDQIIVVASPVKRTHRKKFTPQEDERLRRVVAQLGRSNWKTVALYFQGRDARQCRERWTHYLSPDLVTGDWTEADDELLCAKVAELGTKWSEIAQFFRGRTDIGVKNRYISLTGKKEGRRRK